MLVALNWLESRIMPPTKPNHVSSLPMELVQVTYSLVAMKLDGF